MPQLSQLSDVVLSQLFWLAITLGFIYFVIGRGMLPKIQSTVDQRDQRIADDLAAAEQAKGEADRIEEAYRTRMDESRADAMKQTNAAKQKGQLAMEKQIAKANEAIEAKVAKASAKIGESRAAALANIENVAAELTQEIVGKVAGVTVGRDEAAQAVKAAMING
jgi:F-type H+-transporting ATPase subunit b